MPRLRPARKRIIILLCEMPLVKREKRRRRTQVFLVKNKYKNIQFTNPEKLDWSKIKEAFISPGINLNIKSLSNAKNYKNILGG